MAAKPSKPNVESCLTCPHRQDSSWRVLDDAELARLERGRRVRSCAAGEAVFGQGEDDRAVYCVRSGTIAVRKLDQDGNSVLLSLNYPSDLVGYGSYLTGGEHRTSAEALGPATVCAIDGAAITEAMGHNPKLALELLRRAAAEVEHAQAAIFGAATLSNRDRLVRLLQELLRRHGQACPDGTRRIDLPLSRRDLASMIGVRHETLSRIIGRLEKEGLAQFSGRHVTIPSIQALASAAARPAED